MNTQIHTIPQGFHKLFAYGCICPDRGREFEKKERQRTFEKIILYIQLILTPPPKVIVVLMEIFVYCGNAAIP